MAEKNSLRGTVHYENKLGKGNFATVFGGNLDDGQVAVKRLELDRADNREEAALRKLSHANVVKLLHVEQNAEFKFFFLELCDGTLAEYCIRFPLPQGSEPIDALIQMANGLEYIHSNKLVHRDVKPNNILYCSTNIPESPFSFKISDFGLVRKTSANGTYTMSQVQGTENYMAPELLELVERIERDKSVTETLNRGSCAADVFAMGCVFYFYLTYGAHPFGTRFVIASNILRGIFDLSKLNPDHFALKLIEKMIAKVPTDRPKMAETAKVLNKEWNQRFVQSSEEVLDVMNIGTNQAYKEIYEGNLKEQRLAESLMKSSNFINRGRSSFYQLHCDKRINKRQPFRWFEFGRRKDSVKHKTILLVGATASGKSTLVEEMVNQILGVQWDDYFRFKMVPCDDASPNRTTDVTAYTLYHTQGFSIDYSVTIVDTPGYGSNPENALRDEEISNLIVSFLSKSKLQINAIGFVAHSADAQLTPVQENILKTLKMLLGDDIKNHVRLLATFSDKSIPAVVEACRKAKHPIFATDLNGTNIVYSTFDNAIFADMDQSGNERHVRSLTDNTTVCQSLFKWLGSMQAKSVTVQERCVYRKLVCSNVNLVEEQVLDCLSEISKLRNEKENDESLLQECCKRIVQLKNKILDLFQTLSEFKDDMQGIEFIPQLPSIEQFVQKLKTQFERTQEQVKVDVLNQVLKLWQSGKFLYSSFDAPSIDHSDSATLLRGETVSLAFSAWRASAKKRSAEKQSAQQQSDQKQVVEEPSSSLPTTTDEGQDGEGRDEDEPSVEEQTDEEQAVEKQSIKKQSASRQTLKKQPVSKRLDREQSDGEQCEEEQPARKQSVTKGATRMLSFKKQSTSKHSDEDKSDEERPVEKQPAKKSTARKQSVKKQSTKKYDDEKQPDEEKSEEEPSDEEQSAEKERHSAKKSSFFSSIAKRF